MAEAEGEPANFDSHRIAQLDRSLGQNLLFDLVAGDIDCVDGARIFDVVERVAIEHN